jgi:hypothetical protein
MAFVHPLFVEVQPAEIAALRGLAKRFCDGDRTLGTAAQRRHRHAGR